MNEVKPMTRLRCPLILDFKDFSYSLVDYRNSRFTSQNPDKIIYFYDSFKNRDDLIEWMKERPKGVANIYEVDGDNEITVVIPTADFNGKYAKECRENIFKGLRMIFVESGGREDFYFNFAHNCNIGVKKALEYEPEWIVVSNDDMQPVDSVEDLKNALLKIDKMVDVIFCLPTAKYHSTYAIISNRTARRNTFLTFSGKLDRKRLELEKKFGVQYIVGSNLFPYRLFYSRRYKLRYTGSFGIFSDSFVRAHLEGIFDETYINGAEDIDLSWRLIHSDATYGFINYRIKDIIGGTIGPYSSSRKMRGLVNDCYLNHKIEKGELKLTAIVK